MPSHLTAVIGYGATKGLLLILIVMVIMIPIVLTMGYFSDRIGNKRIIQGGLIGLIFLSIPSFLLIGSGNTLLVFLGLIIISASLFGGTTPLLVAWLINVTKNRLVPAYYLMAACLIGVVATYFVKETAGKPLRGSLPAVEEKHEIQDILAEPEEALWWIDEKNKIDEKIEEAEGLK